MYRIKPQAEGVRANKNRDAQRRGFYSLEHPNAVGFIQHSAWFPHNDNECMLTRVEYMTYWIHPPRFMGT